MTIHQAHNVLRPRGFTLIELLVVISIIGVLSSVILAAVNSARYSANDAKRFSDLRQMEKALDTYYVDNGKYPSTGTNTWNSQCNFTNQITNESYLVNNGATAPNPAFVGTYIPSIPQDPAYVSGTNSNCYAYISNGTDYKLIDYLPSNSNTTNSKVASFVDPAWVATNTIGFRWAVWSPGFRLQS